MQYLSGQLGTADQDSAPAPGPGFSLLGPDHAPEQEAPTPVAPEAPGQPAVTVDLEALGEIERQFDGIDAALRRLDGGAYWTCESCGGPMDGGLLAERPLVRVCRRCEPPDAGAPPWPGRGDP